jgi:glycopeptide antibiotics resistance protein
MKLEKKKIVLGVLFMVYLASLFYVVFFAEAMGRCHPQRYSYNLKLFGEIRRFIVYRHLLGMKAVILNLAGNIIAFIPFGIMFPKFHRHLHHLVVVALCSFLLSLSIEVIQLFTRVGSFDVDDLLLNTMGGFLGYILLLIMEWLIHLIKKGNK